MPPDTPSDGIQTLLLASLLVCSGVATPVVTASPPARLGDGTVTGLSTAAGNTSTELTATASVEPLTPFSGRRATLVANVTGADRLRAVEWRVETPARGTVDRTGNRARFRFRTAGTYTVRLTVTSESGRTARANTTIEMRRTTVRLRGPDGPPSNATLVLDGSGAVGSGVFAVPDDGRVPVLLRRGVDYAATTLQDRDRTTPLHPDSGPADGVPDFAVLGRVTAGVDTGFRLPPADSVVVRVVDAGGDRVVPRGRDSSGAVGIELRHDHPTLPASGFRALSTNATGVAVLDGRPPELAGTVTATVVPLAERFARTDRRLRRELTVDGETRTTFVLDDGTATATAHLPDEAVVGESVRLNATSPASIANATWTVVGPDGESRRLDGRQTTFVPQTRGTFDVTVAVETASGGTAVDRAQLRVANRTVVTGVVRGPDGAPVADAVVRLYRVGNSRTAAAVRGGDGPPRRPTSAALARTDATGRFTATLAAGREYRAVVAQTPLATPPRDGVPDVTLLDPFTAGVDDPGGRLPTARQVTVTAVDDDGDRLTVGRAGNASGEVAVFLGHTPEGPSGPVGWLPGRATVDESSETAHDDSTAASRLVVEVAGSATFLGERRVDWLVETARANHTSGETVRLVVPASDQTPPTARLTAPTRVRIGTTVELDAGNSTDAYGVAGYDWNGSGTLRASGPTARWTPETAGNRTVRVEVVDPAGNVASATATVTVRPDDTGDTDDTGDDSEDTGTDNDTESDDGDTENDGDDTESNGDDTSGTEDSDDTTETSSTASPTETDSQTASPTATETPAPTESVARTPAEPAARTPTRTESTTAPPARTQAPVATERPSRGPATGPNWWPVGGSTADSPTESEQTPSNSSLPVSLRPPAWLPWVTTETPTTAVPPVGPSNAPATSDGPRADDPETQSGDTPARGDADGGSWEPSGTADDTVADGGGTNAGGGTNGDGTGDTRGGSPTTLPVVVLSSLVAGWVIGERRGRRAVRDGHDSTPDTDDASHDTDDTDAGTATDEE